MITTTLRFTADKPLSTEQHTYLVKAINGLLNELPSAVADKSDVPEHGTPATLSGKRRWDDRVDYEMSCDSSQPFTAPQETALVRVLVLACQYMPTEWFRTLPEDKPDCTLPTLVRSCVEPERTVADICDALPDEFRAWVETTANDRGHSAGEDECIAIARGIVAGLLPCIAAYTLRIKP